MTVELEEAKTLLRRTPYVLVALLRGLPEAWVHENEGPDTWSSFDVVGHLLEAEETNWIPRIRHLLERGEAAAFPPFDRFGFAEKVKGRSIAELTTWRRCDRSLNSWEGRLRAAGWHLGNATWW